MKKQSKTKAMPLKTTYNVISGDNNLKNWVQI